MFNVVGQVLGTRYEILEFIGSGGMAEVYRARHIALDRPVAIKIMHRSLAQDPQFQSRFEREARLIAQLRHPNIIQVYDFESVKANLLYYMVVELIEGGSLNDRLLELHRRGEFMPIAEVLRIAKDITHALGYAHQQGMVHRDVKPANVLLEHGQRVVLSDFGLARLAAGSQMSLTGSGILVGTPAYMSPEQGLGGGGDARSDLYSVGVTLYQMVTNQLPFMADTPVGMVLRHVSEPPPSPLDSNPTLSPGLVNVIRRCLAKAPESRYQSAEQLLADLEAPDRVAPPTQIFKPETAIAPWMTPLPPPNLPKSPALNAPRGRLVRQAGFAALLVVLLGLACLAGSALSGGLAGMLPPPIAVAFGLYTKTATPSPTFTATATTRPSATLTPTSTDSPTLTPTLTVSPSNTALPTVVVTPSDDFSATAAFSLSATASLLVSLPQTANNATETPDNGAVDVPSLGADVQPTDPPSPTATQLPCVLLPNVSYTVNIREGPSLVYPVLGNLAPGSDPQVVMGVFPSLSTPSWWQIRYFTLTGWVSASLSTVSGACNAIPVAYGPPLPTSTPLPPTDTPQPPLATNSISPPATGVSPTDTPSSSILPTLGRPTPILPTIAPIHTN